MRLINNYDLRLGEERVLHGVTSTKENYVYLAGGGKLKNSDGVVELQILIGFNRPECALSSFVIYLKTIDMNKIAIVVIYFGKFPNYFPLWLKSCGYNKSIDFYVFCDSEINNPPKNVYVVYTNLEEVRNRASTVLGFEASLSHPYKCCDYRPIYGVMFADYLSKYDFWGHCDIDLIFGDLQYFFDEYNLYDYDKFGTLGHLSLFKNNPEVNNAYKIHGSLQDYKDVYQTEDNTLFDELCGISTMMIEHGYKVFCKRIFVDIATRYKRFRIIDVYNLDEKPVNYPFQTFYWENGKTYRAYYDIDTIRKEEYIYIHFQKRPNYEICKELENSESFYITNEGFVPKREILTKELISKLNPYKGRVSEAIECFITDCRIRLKFKIKRWLSL